MRSTGARRERTRRPGRLFALLLLVLGSPLLLLGLDSAWTASMSPERRTVITVVSDGHGGADTYDPWFATVFLNGLGLDISEAQARALTPSVGRYGRVLALQYASVFDPNAAADTLRDALREGAGAEAKPTSLTVVASSMGDVRGLEIIASLQDRHPDVEVVGFVVNTGPGPGKRVRVRGGPTVQALLDQSCTPFVPGRVTLALLEVLNQANQGKVGSPTDVARAYKRGLAYRSRAVANQLCSLTRPSAVVEPPWVPFTAYLTTGTPADDSVVDGVGAYRDWRAVLPGMQLRRIQGATHDNFSYRPDLFNPVFADDLMPRIRAQQLARGPVTRSSQPDLPRPV